jgi:rod shape-determining protein MreD
MARDTANALPVPQIDNAAARLLPVATTVLMAVLSVQPVHMPGYAELSPAFMLMAVYHWTIYRPDLLPSSALFLIGVAYDLLAGNPPGVTALLLLLSRAVVLRCRRWFIYRPFPFVWSGFTLLAGSAMLGMWALHCLLDTRLLEFRGTIFRAVLTISLFPIASFLLGRAQRALMGAG